MKPQLMYQRGIYLMEILIIGLILMVIVAGFLPVANQYQDRKKGIEPKLEKEFIGNLEDCKIYLVKPPYYGRGFYRQECPDGTSTLLNKDVLNK
jgi:hypothetical protein